MKVLLAAARTSEFWVVLAAVVVEFIKAPVPAEYQTVGWIYVGFRIVSKMAQFMFPHPDSPNAGWMKKDS